MMFMEAYTKYKVTVADNEMSLNVLDTVGLTQTGDDKNNRCKLKKIRKR